MDTHRIAGLLAELRADPRVEAAAMDGDDLVVRTGGEFVRFASDPEHERTACWAQARRLSAGEAKPAARAARRYNSGVKEATRLTMGLFLEGNALILGRSVDKGELDAAELLGLAGEIAAGLADARSLVEATLEEQRAAERQAFAAPGDVPLVRA